MTISEHDQLVIDELEQRLDATPQRHIGAGNRRWLVAGFTLGLVLVCVGIALDHAVGFGAAVAGFVALTLCFGDIANLIAEPWLGKGRHLSFHRWSSF